MINIDPAKLQLAKDILSSYIEDNKLRTFNIIHLYPDYTTELKDNDCFHDSLKFKAVIYNTELKKFAELGHNHDQIEFKDFYLDNQLPVDILRIFADGSVFIRFSVYVTISGFYRQVLQLTTKDV